MRLPRPSFRHHLQGTRVFTIETEPFRLIQLDGATSPHKCVEGGRVYLENAERLKSKQQLARHTFRVPTRVARRLAQLDAYPGLTVDERLEAVEVEVLAQGFTELRVLGYLGVKPALRFGVHRGQPLRVPPLPLVGGFHAGTDWRKHSRCQTCSTRCWKGSRRQSHDTKMYTRLASPTRSTSAPQYGQVLSW